MKKIPISCFLFITVFISCKKDNLIEVVDVPAAPIVAIEQKGNKPSDLKAIEGSFPLYPLPFMYNALEPYLDASTLELHYAKHYLPYINALNKAVQGTAYAPLELEMLLKVIPFSDTNLRNAAGAVYNHEFYFKEIAPNAGKEPQNELLEVIIQDFGSYDQFIKQVAETAVKNTGSGWLWVMSDKYGHLKIITTPNNDCPLLKDSGIKGVPILNLDLWEHAYYLKFQNKKREYANTFFSIINWEVVEKRYQSFTKVVSPNAPLSSTINSTTTDTKIQKEQEQISDKQATIKKTETPTLPPAKKKTEIKKEPKKVILKQQDKETLDNPVDEFN